MRGPPASPSYLVQMLCRVLSGQSRSPPATRDTSPEYLPVAASEPPAAAYAETADSDSPHTVHPPACAKAAHTRSSPASAPAPAKKYPATSSPPPPQRHKAVATRTRDPPRTAAGSPAAPETSAPASPQPQKPIHSYLSLQYPAILRF